MKLKGRSKVIGFDDKLLLFIGIPAVSVIMSLIVFGVDNIATPVMYVTRCLPISLVYTTIFWLAFRQIMIQFRLFFPRPNDSGKRIILQTITIIAGYFLLKLGVDPLVDNLFGEGDRSSPLQVSNTGSNAASIIVTFLVTAIYEGMYFYNLFQKTEIEKERLERTNILSQLEGLRSHVNPHFLFNSLNTLAQLIPEDQVKAERFVHQLSRVYRYILEIRKKKLIPLSEELAFLNAYRFLLEERFGDKLNFDIRIEDTAMNRYMIPLALQILIENAIKHNVISNHKPLLIEIFNQGAHKLIVQNNLQRKRKTTSSTGFGLENIKSRYQYYTDETVDIIPTQSTFIVSIPLLPQPEKELVSA